jgi:hypothetical protein
MSIPQLAFLEQDNGQTLVTCSACALKIEIDERGLDAVTKQSNRLQFSKRHNAEKHSEE